MNQYFIVFRFFSKDLPFEYLGIFDDKEKAIAECKTENHFYNTITFNAVGGEVSAAVFPLAETKAVKDSKKEEAE